MERSPTGPSGSEADPGPAYRAQRRRAAGWRLAWFASTGLAVAALLAALWFGTREPPLPVVEGIASFVLLVEEDGTPRWVVETAASGQVLARPIGRREPPPGLVHQLWIVEADTILPVGVLDSGQGIPLELPEVLSPHAVFVVSIEPPGGSPTVVPTGAVVMTGVPRP